MSAASKVVLCPEPACGASVSSMRRSAKVFGRAQLLAQVDDDVRRELERHFAAAHPSRSVGRLMRKALA